MAKARIVYEVDDRELDKLQKQLNEIKGQNEDVEEGFKGSNEELKKTGGILGDLKGAVAGLGLAAVATAAIAQFAKLTQEIIKNRKEVAQLTNATGKALDTITAKVKATSEVFGQDFNETLRTANTLSKEFGISMTEAIEEVNEGFSRGLDINGDYLETLREYSTFIKEAGLNTRQFNVLIQRQVQQGIFSDKGIDAIKEAVISIREMTPATRDAIQSIGIDTDRLIADIRSGATTYFEAVQQIATKTRELADPQKTGVILADVFRGAGEDAGNFVFTLDQVGNEFAELTKETQQFKEGQDKLIEATEDWNTELIKLTKNVSPLGTAWKTFINDAGAGTLRFINDLINGFNNLDKELVSYEEGVRTLTVDEQAAEFDKLTEKLNQVKERLDPNSKKYIFGVSEEDIELGQKELDELTGKIAILDKITQERNQAAIDQQAELNAQLEKETLAREAAAKATQKQAEEDAARQDPGEIESIAPSLDPNIGDQMIANEIKLEEDLFAIREDAREKEQAAKDEQARLDEERNTRQREIAEESALALSEIFQGFTDLRIQQITQEINALELGRNRELELAEGNKEKEAAINKKFDAEISSLRTKQANQQKLGAIFDIAVNTGVGISKTIAQLGLPAAVPFIALAAGIGAAQAAFVLAQPVPKFAKGTLDVPGSGTGDTIHAMLTPHEAVLPVDINRDYHPAIKAIYTRSIDPDIINQIAKNGGSVPNITVNDYDKLAKAVMNQPKFDISMNESGFNYHMFTKNKSLEFKQNKFKF